MLSCFLRSCNKRSNTVLLINMQSTDYAIELNHLLCPSTALAAIDRYDPMVALPKKKRVKETISESHPRPDKRRVCKIDAMTTEILHNLLSQRFISKEVCKNSTSGRDSAEKSSLLMHPRLPKHKEQVRIPCRDGHPESERNQHLAITAAASGGMKNTTQVTFSMQCPFLQYQK